MEMGWKPNIELSPACPRCGSSNTKFCYYNNYSLTQPRYFCKGCRRYWTKGGSLRNVPIGGGCRKSRRGKSIRSAAQAATSRNSALTNPTHEPTSTTSIDLAAVYANFLSQPPSATTLSELPDGVVIPPVLQMNQNLPQDNRVFECGAFLGGGGNNSTFTATGTGFGGMNALPPLPGGEVWPSSEMLLHNQVWPFGQEIIGGELQPELPNLSGGISPLTRFNIDAIFRS